MEIGFTSGSLSIQGSVRFDSVHGANVERSSAGNIPGHIFSAIAYQVLQQERAPTIETVRVVLERHPWYANQ
jgi:hypothetical protein